MKTSCQFCDSGNVEQVEIKESYPIPFCENVIVPHSIYRCNDCGGEGTLSSEKELIKQITKANFSSAHILIDTLVKNGITMTYFEKALRLPFRTTSRWKKGKISHSSLALLRFIRCFPGLLEVADENFTEQAQAKFHITQPGHFFARHTTNPSGSFDTTGGKIELHFEGGFRPPYTQSISSAEPKSIWGDASK